MRRRSGVGVRLAAFAVGIAVAAATLVVVPTPWPASADDTGPAIAHVPVATAPYGRPIQVSLASTCATGAACSAWLYYRTTAPAALAAVPGIVNEGGFQVVALSRWATTTIEGREAVEWVGAIPGSAATTAGVDYFIEVDHAGKRARFPGSTAAGGAQPTGSYQHVAVLAPPLLDHVPVPLAVAGHGFDVDARVSCSTGNCQATLYYRKTPATLDAAAGWASASMASQGVVASLGDAATLLAYRGHVPAAAVDTTGVDYYIRVTDGHVQAFSPGTPYQGHYAPRDGTHVAGGNHHVHVVEPPRLAHVPVATAPYRQGIAVSARANCPSTRTCQATLYYRTTPAGAASTAPFASAPMTVTRTIGTSGLDAIAVDGTIPAAMTDTRGVDYFFSVTDGTTTSWWPGTSAADGPGVWVDGIRVLYHHIHVQEPVHALHVPPTIAQALTDLPIEATLACATEQCSATLHYSSRPDAAGGYVAVPMSRLSSSTVAGASRAEVWRAVIPAAAVTTRGLAYYMTASDGYTNTAAPGTSYWGAYAVVDGGNPAPATARFVTRVVDPPHPVHVPPATANTGEAVPIEARSNCATRACTATLHWRITGQAWRSTTMAAGVPLPLAYGNELVPFTASVPGSGVTPDGIEYRIEVNDGYVTESTPTFPVVVRKVPNHAVGSVRFAGAADLPVFPCAQTAPCSGTFEGEWLGHLTGSLDDSPFEVAWRTLPGRVNIEASFEYWETTCAMPDGGAALGFASGTGRASSGSEEVIGTLGSPTTGIPRVITAITLEFSFTWTRAATGAVLTLSPTSFTVEVAGLGPRTILTGTQRGVATFAAESASSTHAPTCATPLEDVQGAVAGTVELASA